MPVTEVNGDRNSGMAIKDSYFFSSTVIEWISCNLKHRLVGFLFIVKFSVFAAVARAFITLPFIEQVQFLAISNVAAGSGYKVLVNEEIVM